MQSSGSDDAFEIGSITRRKYTEKRLIRKLPPNMIKRETHKLLENAININNILSSLLDTPEYNNLFNILINKINLIFDEKNSGNSEMKYNYFIGGGRAWNNFFRDFYDNNLLSPYEKSSIHNTNADLYYFTNNLELLTQDTGILKEIKELFKEAIVPLVDAIKLYLNDPSKNVIITIEEQQCLNFKYALIPAKRLYLQLSINNSVPEHISQIPQSSQLPKPPKQAKSQTPRVTTGKSKAQIEAEEKKKKDLETALKKEQSKRNREARLSTRRGTRINGGTIDIDIKKTILSFDLYYNNTATMRDYSILINNISNIIEVSPKNGLNYLNLYGLYIFLQLSKKKIFIPKGYNVFKIREIIYDKLILLEEYKIQALKDISDRYYATFDKTTLFDMNMYNEFQKLYALSINDISTIITQMEITIIERLRPYINDTIKNINDLLQDFNEHLGIFIAGGDALRRYKNDISVTKDIDSKIYIPQSLATKENMKRVHKIIKEELILLVCFLIDNNDIIMSDIKTEYKERNFSINFILNNADKDIKNYRFRQILKNPFPVDLYSLDYRCKINVNIYDNVNAINNTKFIYDYDIAFIDIVLEILNKTFDINFYKNNAIYSNGLPISTLEFLLADLKNTYNSDTSSLLRFIGGKIDKDYNRYRTLLDLIKHKSTIFQYSKDKFTRKKYKFDDNSYIYEYIPEGLENPENPDNIELPVLIEKPTYNQNYNLRLELDKMKIYFPKDMELVRLFNAYYVISRANPVRRKIMYSFNKNEVETFALAYINQPKQKGTQGGNKLDAIITDKGKFNYDDDIEILNKSLCELSVYDDISNDIVNDIGERKIELGNKLIIPKELKELKEPKEQQKDIDNYIIDIMTSQNKLSKKNLPPEITNFYKNLNEIFIK
jgi:hypothetical protein